MSFLNAKLWPNIPAEMFRQQYEQLNLSEPQGLWFRAIGSTKTQETVVVEVWDSMLSWRAVHEAEKANRQVKDAKTAHQAFKPIDSIRQEMTSYFFPMNRSHQHSEWFTVETVGQILVVEFPQISAQKYEAGIGKHGQQEGMKSSQSVICSVDGPDDGHSWIIARIEMEVDANNAEQQKHLADLEKPHKADKYWQAKLQYAYFTQACPARTENQFVEGFFL